MEKNVGKTVTLNYILRRLADADRQIAVTSIGIDGETVDQVIRTAKPEIIVGAGTLFTTSEQHYPLKQVVSEVMALSRSYTSLGRLVTAKAMTSGPVLLSGPADTHNLNELIDNNKSIGVDLTLVDGALSRLSLASPTVTDAMILATGAAYSLNMTQLIRGTSFVCTLIRLCKTDEATFNLLADLNRGVYAIDSGGVLHKLPMESAMLFESSKETLNRYGQRLFVSGVLTDKLLAYIRMQRWCDGYEIIVRDFTKLFITPETYSGYVRKGGRISVLYKTNLLGVTVNPTSPKGYTLNSQMLCDELSAALQQPVYDVMKIM